MLAVCGGRRGEAGRGWGCRQNRVLQYAAVARAGVADPAAHLQAAFPADLPLRTAFLAADLAALADAAAEDALSSASWCPTPPPAHPAGSTQMIASL